MRLQLFLNYWIYASIQLVGDGIKKKSLSKLFKQGFIMSVLNPKVSIFFLAFFQVFYSVRQLTMLFSFMY